MEGANKHVVDNKPLTSTLKNAWKVSQTSAIRNLLLQEDQGRNTCMTLNGRVLLPSGCEENNVSVQSGIKTCLLTQAGLSPPDMI